MKDINFFSESTYFSIPNSKDPKVVLAIEKGSFAKKSFKLYNPFSQKAKVFKSLRVFFVYVLILFLEK